MNKNIFITTTLPYSNGKIHVGAAFEFILGDSINRFLKSKGYNTYFNIGLDQNGSKILAKSKELNIPYSKYLEEIKNDWIDSCSRLQIEYDNFYETCSKEHAKKVKEIWNIFVKNGDIYEKEYTGKYCIGCESYLLEKDLVDGKCTDHPNTELQVMSEKNYFFNLDKYRVKLLEWLETKPFIPENKENELRNFINEYKEISVSRIKSDSIVGINVPNDDSQIIYIWAEALCNYLISCSKWNDWNDCDIIQIYGPDNNRFQSQIFQCFLSALGKKNTDKLLVHGTILDKDGRKISKTLGNTIDPIEQLEKYGLDAVKYYALCGLSTYQNSSWSEDDLVRLYNNDLCNDWGNLVARTLHLIDIKSVDTDIIDNIFRKNIDNLSIEVEDLWLEFRVKEALQKTNEIVKLGNKYINDEKPWSSDNYNVILSNLNYLVNRVNELYLPVFPGVYSRVNVALKDRKKVILFNKINQV